MNASLSLSYSGIQGACWSEALFVQVCFNLRRYTGSSGEHERAFCSAWGRNRKPCPRPLTFSPSKPRASVPNLPCHQVTHRAETAEPACFSTPSSEGTARRGPTLALFSTGQALERHPLKRLVLPRGRLYRTESL